MRIHDGDTDTFRALAYDVPAANVVSHLSNMTQDYDRRLTGRAREYFDSIQESVPVSNFRELKSRVISGFRRLGNMFTPDIIRTLNSISELQHPPEIMINYIMAEPTVRKRYYEQRCDGYGDRYVDKFPNRIGNDDPFYRNVMDGVLQEDENGKCFYMDYDTDFEDESITRLDTEERECIIETWDLLVKRLYSGGEDPTSQYNNLL